MRRGLRSRIIWTTALISAVAMAAMIGTVILVLNAVTRNNVRSTLEDRLSVISSGIASNKDGPAQALESPVDSIEDGTWLFDSVQHQIEGPKAGRRVQAAAESLADVTKKTWRTKRERTYLSAPVNIRGGSTQGRGVLVVSQNLEPYQDTRTEILFGLIALGLLVTAGSSAIAAWTMTRTLAPVQAMADLAEDWSERELDARFDEIDAQNEISNLGHTLNVLLDRVAGALRGEQRLTSELAHELRTPLSGIRGEAELALMSERDPAGRERLERVVALVDQMSTTITTLLAIARGDAQPSQRSTVDQVVAATVDSSPVGRDIEVSGVSDVPRGVRVNATTQSAVRALSPLVQNALQHASREVSISVDEAPRSVAITVSDDGPGLVLGNGDPEALFAAGARGSESSGAGLGLSLARRVARSLGGEVTVTSTNTPTSFTLTLPRP